MVEKIVLHDNKDFEDVDFSNETLRDREFCDCTFIRCNFNSSDLRGNCFDQCRFEHCDFTLAEIEGVGFRRAVFKYCKLMGMNFGMCNKLMFSFEFEHCILDYSSLSDCKLQKTQFIECSMQEVDFSDSDLTGASFKMCDLNRALFSRTVLVKADFRTATNFCIDPECNKVKKAKFTSFQLENLLLKYNLDIE